jgi:hypothetical protein
MSLEVFSSHSYCAECNFSEVHSQQETFAVYPEWMQELFKREMKVARMAKQKDHDGDFPELESAV